MDSYQLPSNAYYSKEGAIIFRKSNKAKDIEKVDKKVEELQKQIEELKNLLVNKDKENG